MESPSQAKSGSILGGALLVAGTSIGGGMLGLPVLTSQGGFVPSLFVYLACWLFMASTGLLLLELSLTYGEGANLVTMASRTLGKAGKYAAWVLYLFLFYSLTIAYMVGCGNIFTEASNGHLTAETGSILFTLVFAPFVWAGARLIGPFNTLMMLILGVLYFTFIALALPYIDLNLLSRRDWPLTLMALPIVFISFAFQGIIPTLNSYMNHDGKKARTAILIGSFIPLVTYALWQGIILGIVPVEGPFGLKETLELGQNAVWPLKHFISSSAIWMLGQYFAFFALLTSFLGVTLGLLDFLADGLDIKKTSWGKILLCLMVFVPPLIIALYHPHVFLTALNFAGGYGSALLLGLLPILMVWSKRYYQHNHDNKQLSLEKMGLTLLILFVLFEVVLETVKN